MSNDDDDDCYKSSSYNDDNDVVLLLKNWNTITTRLLQDGEKSSAWNYIDGVMDNDNDNNNFPISLEKELEKNNIWTMLQPAKTTMEITTSTKNDEVLFLQLHDILEKNNVLSNGEAIIAKKKKQETNSNIRGDKSIFITREFRKTKQFYIQYPLLTKFISTIENTIQKYLSITFEWDFKQTSVQIAQYPGDGVSGYTKHCDVQGNICQYEEESSDQQQQKLSTKFDRLITIVYYITPYDWNEKLDGGHIRLYNGNNDNNNYTDIVPYSGRLVIFRSDCIEHEVLPSLRRSRRAITVWLYGRKRLNAENDNDDMTTATHTDTINITMDFKNNTSIDKPCLKYKPNAVDSEVKITSAAASIPAPLPVNNNIIEAGQDNNASSKIFVSIAAYRDSETGPTIRNLMATARYPERVYIGLVLQIDTTTTTKQGGHQNDDRGFNDQVEVLDKLPCNESWWDDHVRVLHIDAKHSTGPCNARALGQQLYRNEEYMLQIDSHMRFRYNWDIYLIEQIHMCPNPEYTILTTYPIGYTLPNNIPNVINGTLLIPWKFDHDGMLRTRGVLLKDELLNNNNNNNNNKPILCQLYAAGFNFCLAKNVLELCPYTSLHYLFFGEEIYMSIRLYLSGFNMYTPTQSVCYHLWTRTHRPTTFTNNNSNNSIFTKQQQRRKSQKVVQELIATGDYYEKHVDNETTMTKRTVSDFAMEIGVNFDKKTILFETLDRYEYKRNLIINSENNDDSLFEPNNCDSNTTTTTQKIEKTLNPTTKNLIYSFLGFE